ncbi:hypothetical protein BDV96DRAFT_504966 [Lophiotrema nucula]|uniref:Uncharacterized protein n=1 Tax=Lophiotrema nucula TaxID=690887 RepID=A0A6A5YLS7_9PLEO|nr:hypothetical protein BDV96DRAFT_504966 [Lophiotrema nucula]
MVDANDSTPPGPASSGSANSQGIGLFGRRPSFFGGKSKAPRTATPPARTSTPPHASRRPSAEASSRPGLTSTGLIYAAPSIVPSTPPRKRHGSRHSISASVAEIGTTLRRSRSASLRTNDSSRTSSSHQRTPSATLALSFSPEKNAGPYASSAASRPALSISTFSRNKKSSENVKAGEGGAKQGYEKSPLSAVDNPKTPFNMATMPLRYPPTQKELQKAQREQNYGGNFNGGLAPAAPISVPSGGVNPNIIFQNIHELASKRISTLDYLRKAHEGRIYWFNTLLFSKPDLTRLPSFTPRNLSRRATNYLLLGFSLPTILDLNSNSATDYLKALNALLLEFETYQTIHPPDGVTASSLSRGRVGNMFKRVGVTGGGKGMGMSMGRRSSSAANDFPTLTKENSYGDSASAVDSPPTDDLLLPNESYTYLQTPSLPFDPDFFSTFATLCDVLIDCYTKILTLLSTPESVVSAGNGVPSTVGDLFSKADARVRKIILAGVVREFEESCRQGVRGEVGGVGKVILGGLM